MTLYMSSTHITQSSRMVTPKFANVCEFQIARYTRHISPDLWRDFCFCAELSIVGAFYQDSPEAAAFSRPSLQHPPSCV